MVKIASTLLRLAMTLSLLAWMAPAAIAHAWNAADSMSAPGPGEYVWFDDSASPVEALTLVVSLPLQRLHVYRGETLIGIAAVSTGKPGHATPIGDFRILQKKSWHRSNLYSDAPMPFMQRLTWDGIAIHAGENPGMPASHGCIRLPTAFARKLFAMTALGGAVLVTDQPFAPPLYLPFVDLDWAYLDQGVSAGTADRDAPPRVMAMHMPLRLEYSPSVFDN